MPNFIAISHLDETELDPYRNQKDAWLRASHYPGAGTDATPTGLAGGRFLAEGDLVFEQLLASPYTIESVLVSESRIKSLEPLLERLPGQVPVYVGPPSILEGIVGFDMHRGVLACGLRGPDRSLEAVLDVSKTLVILEDLANHDNVGGIARCLRALGGKSPGMLLTPRCCDPLYRRALRVSIGHMLHIPFARLDWPADIERVRRAGFAILALSPDSSATPIDRVPAAARVCLIAGAEGPGLSGHATRLADHRVRIGMHPAVDSLNVSVSVAIALHALGRNDSK
ncbi:MAG: RNA methyltransferase [Phycisphaeraceae bacterium]|nr:RNA methyltransferase [Phycisphaeraceae bacterium]MCW5764176.1 RNA methyltransferase [Phycisphaeraceae bacterium]